jgi:hypothetical protein
MWRRPTSSAFPHAGLARGGPAARPAVGSLHHVSKRSCVLANANVRASQDDRNDSITPIWQSTVDVAITRDETALRRVLASSYAGRPNRRRRNSQFRQVSSRHSLGGSTTARSEVVGCGRCWGRTCVIHWLVARSLVRHWPGESLVGCCFGGDVRLACLARYCARENERVGWILAWVATLLGYRVPPRSDLMMYGVERPPRDIVEVVTHVPRHLLPF